MAIDINEGGKKQIPANPSQDMGTTPQSNEQVQAHEDGNNKSDQLNDYKGKPERRERGERRRRNRSKNKEGGEDNESRRKEREERKERREKRREERRERKERKHSRSKEREEQRERSNSKGENEESEENFKGRGNRRRHNRRHRRSNSRSDPENEGKEKPGRGKKHWDGEKDGEEGEFKGRRRREKRRFARHGEDAEEHKGNKVEGRGIPMTKEELQDYMESVIKDQVQKLKISEPCSAPQVSQSLLEAEKRKIEQRLVKEQLTRVEEMLATYVCPITAELMRTPVMAEDGQTYEEADIANWLRKHSTSPLTGKQIGKKLTVNYKAKDTIADLKGQKEKLEKRIAELE